VTYTSSVPLPNQDTDSQCPIEFSNSLCYSLQECSLSWRIQYLNQQLSKYKVYIWEVSQLLQEIRKEVNILLNACPQVLSANSVTPEALADKRSQVIGEGSLNSCDLFTFTINPLLPDDATESFTLLASSSSEDSEVRVESNVVAVDTTKPQSERLKRKWVSTYPVFSTLANGLKQLSSQKYFDAGVSYRYSKDFVPTTWQQKCIKHADSRDIHITVEAKRATAKEELLNRGNPSCTLPLSQRPCRCEMRAQSKSQRGQVYLFK
jgi:hypothetical protein